MKRILSALILFAYVLGCSQIGAASGQPVTKILISHCHDISDHHNDGDDDHDSQEHNHSVAESSGPICTPEGPKPHTHEVLVFGNPVCALQINIQVLNFEIPSRTFPIPLDQRAPTYSPRGSIFRPPIA